MSDEQRPDIQAERQLAACALPEDIANEFLAGTLSESGRLVHEGDTSRIWRCFEQEIDVPNIGRVLLRVDYRQYDNPDNPPPFDQIRFDYVAVESDAEGRHPLIAEMHWYIAKGPTQNPYPFDFALVHRYLVPEYRERLGVGSHLYQQAEAWAQQVANKKGADVILALSTDQPVVMDWSEGRGYRPYPEEEERRREVLEHPERFQLVTETDEQGQIRSPALRRDGKPFPIWFTRQLSARTNDE